MVETSLALGLSASFLAAFMVVFAGLGTQIQLATSNVRGTAEAIEALNLLSRDISMSTTAPVVSLSGYRLALTSATWDFRLIPNVARTAVFASDYPGQIPSGTYNTYGVDWRTAYLLRNGVVIVRPGTLANSNPFGTPDVAVPNSGLMLLNNLLPAGGTTSDERLSSGLPTPPFLPVTPTTGNPSQVRIQLVLQSDERVPPRYLRACASNRKHF